LVLQEQYLCAAAISGPVLDATSLLGNFCRTINLHDHFPRDGKICRKSVTAGQIRFLITQVLQQKRSKPQIVTIALYEPSNQ
jgi:hypothetical protein